MRVPVDLRSFVHRLALVAIRAGLGLALAGGAGPVALLPAARVPVVQAGSGPTLTVPPSTVPMTVDANCDPTEYQGAAQASLFVTPASSFFVTVTALLKHTTHDLFVCFYNMPLPQTGNAGAVAVYIDRDNDGGGPDADDLGIFVHPNGQASAGYWNAASGSFDGPDPGGWSAASVLCSELCEWGAVEIRVPRTVVGGWRRTVGLALFYHWFRFPADDYAWPANNVWANPALWGNAFLSNDSVTVGQSGSAPTLDGLCTLGVGSEYGDAVPLTFLGSGGNPVDVLLKHTATDLYICFDNLAVPAPFLRNGPNAAVYLGRNASAGETTSADDLVFSIAYDGTVRANRGSGSGFSGPDPGSYAIARQQLAGEWNAEFRIGLAALGGGWHPVDLALAQQWVSFGGDDYGWPGSYLWNLPNSWALANLTTTPAPTGLDLQAAAIEVTQSIQDLNNSVVLVANKRTFVRVHVATNLNRSGVTARLYGSLSGLSAGLSPLMPLNPGGVINAITNTARAAMNDSFLFELPASWLTGGYPLVLRAEINPFRAIPEINYGNNSLTTAPLQFLSTNSLQLVSVNFKYRRLNGALVQASENDMRMLESEIRRMYPISSLWARRVDFMHAGLFVNTCPSFPWICVNDLPNVVTVNAEIALLRAYYGLTPPIHGLVHDRGDNGTGLGSGFMRGMGLPVIGVASSPTGPGTWGWDLDGSYGDWYGAHETGHAMWRHHTSACGEDGPFQNYPRAGALLGPFFGFDVGDASLGLARAVLPGDIWTDVMSYCSPIWISDVTYQGLRNYIQTGLPLAAQVVGPPAAPEHSGVTGDFLTLAGFVDLEHLVAALPLVARSGEVPVVPPLAAGPYHIRLHDAGDSILASYAFSPTVDSDSSNLAMVYQVVNFQPGTRRISIYADAAAAEIASLPVSANPPAVAVTGRSGGPSLPATGPVTVTWTGSDPDGDALSYTLQYSPNGGTSWRSMAAGLTSAAVTVDAAQLEGTGGSSTGRFRVVANDGVLTGHGDSDSFSVAGKAPEVSIASPVSGTTYAYGQLVALEGDGQDFEDGTLGNAGLSWASSLDGSLGTGRLAHTALLSVGTHQITLTATDSQGQSGSATVVVHIAADVAQPGPTLEVAPNLIVFAAPNDSVPGSLTLSVRNIGTGALDWTAASDQPWVTLAAASGSAPADVAVSVDPADLPGAAKHVAHITLTASGAAGSPQTVTVVLDKTLSPRRLYLPAVNR